MTEVVENTLDVIRPLVADILCVEPAWVQPDAALAEAPGSDSLDIVELQIALEDSLGVELPDAELADVRTCGQLADVVERRLNQRANP